MNVHIKVCVPESGQWLTFAFVCRIGSQGIAEKPFFAPVAVEAGGVVDALQTFSCQAVAVANRIGVYVVVTLTWTAQSHGPIAAQRVSKVAVITELTSLAWERENQRVRKKGLRHSCCGSPTGTYCPVWP